MSAVQITILGFSLVFIVILAYLLHTVSTLQREVCNLSTEVSFWSAEIGKVRTAKDLLLEHLQIEIVQVPRHHKIARKSLPKGECATEGEPGEANVS